jgi:hypothetical protein
VLIDDGIWGVLAGLTCTFGFVCCCCCAHDLVGEALLGGLDDGWNDDEEEEEAAAAAGPFAARLRGPHTARLCSRSLHRITPSLPHTHSNL